MGVRAHYLRCDEPVGRWLQSHPEDFELVQWALRDWIDADFIADAREEPDILVDVGADLEQFERFIDSPAWPAARDHSRRECNIGKSWEGIHFVLTGQKEGGEPPEAWVVKGAPGYGEGMGEIWILEPDQVSRVAEALQEFDEQTFRQRYDADRLVSADVYPTAIWGRDPEEGLEFLLDHYRELRVFFRVARDEGQCVLLTMSY